MDDCARSLPSIAVYVDGELDAPHAVDLEAHLAACRPCRERLLLLWATRRSLKRAASRRCSDALRARVSEMVALDRRRGAWTRALEGAARARRLRLRLRCAAGLAAAAGVVLLSTGAGREPDRQVILAGSDILEDLVSLHERPLPPETTDPEELSRWDPLVGVRVRRPRFQPFGATFTGARVHAMADRRAALLQYSLGGGRRATVYVFNPRVVSVKAMPLERRVVREHAVYVGSRRGYAIAAAEQRDIGYALASDLGAEQSAELMLDTLMQ